MQTRQQQLENLQDLGSDIVGQLKDLSVSAHVAHGELTLEVDASHILKVLKYLRDDGRCRFVSLIDICGVDYPSRPKRFDVVYHLLSPKLNERIRVKVAAGEGDLVPSAVSIFSGALWFEREAYDMYGILFSNHPDMRRLLTDYSFEGFPLRKDFPLTGFVELRYDDEEKKVVYEPVKLTQEFRQFDFLSPWEGPDPVLPGDEKASS